MTIRKMKLALSLCISLICCVVSSAQKAAVTPAILTTAEVRILFPDTACNRLGISYPIFRVYRYIDKTGLYYCILTESNDGISESKDTLHHDIKAVNVRADRGTFIKTWEINDHVIPEQNEESSVWFWTKYTDFKDYDGNGQADPVIVYGTAGMNGYDDGRIKFIIYFNGKKIAIRHQNGVLDPEKETQVDKAFYDLPQTLQAAIRQKMELMMKNNHAIFPAGWQAAMKNRKTVFNER
ncbi:M949_RS01915 family surface polysaccharide biosynthesis protein [Chitinophagaceae bacterium MMS25-I14]